MHNERCLCLPFSFHSKSKSASPPGDCRLSYGPPHFWLRNSGSVRPFNHRGHARCRELWKVAFLSVESVTFLGRHLRDFLSVGGGGRTFPCQNPPSQPHWRWGQRVELRGVFVYPTLQLQETTNYKNRVAPTHSRSLEKVEGRSL